MEKLADVAAVLEAAGVLFNGRRAPEPRCHSNDDAETAALFAALGPCRCKFCEPE